jgi:hypothetical protein
MPHLVEERLHIDVDDARLPEMWLRVGAGGLAVHAAVRGGR